MERRDVSIAALLAPGSSIRRKVAAEAPWVVLAGTAGLLLLGSAVLSQDHPYARAVVWSVLMLLSFVGWGSLVNLALAPRRWADWGLRAGWGMGLSLATGGYLSVAHLAVRAVLVAQVGLGVAAWLCLPMLRARPARSLRRRLVAIASRPGFVIVVAAYAVAALTFLASLGNRWLNPSDDLPLYLALAEKLVQAGSLFEPFSARRIVTLGGQVYLDASFISLASVRYVHAVDAGISLLVVVGLLVGLVRASGPKTRHAAALGLAFLLLFSLGDVRANTGSLMSGVAAFLTLYRTVRAPQLLGLDGPASWLEPRRVAMLAALTVVCVLLRTSNLTAAGPFVALVLVSDFVHAMPRPWNRATVLSVLGVAGLFAGAFVVTLLPWSVMLRQSTGTFFYPLGHDNVTPGWTFLRGAAGWEELITRLIKHLFYEKPVAAFCVFAAAGLVPAVGRARNDLVALTIAALVGVFVLSRQATGFEPSDMCRYYYAFVVATSLVAAASIGRAGASAGAALVAAGLAVQLTVGREAMRGLYLDYIKRVFEARRETYAEMQDFNALSADYLDVQSHVPPGATIVTAVHEDLRFDFSRNPIFALDLLGGMGPKPGWPAYRGPDALVDYLKASGVGYLIKVDFSLPSEFYNRDHWRVNLTRSDFLGGEAQLQLDAEDTLDKLVAVRRVVYAAHGMTVVDLASPP
jgi:hypothetical protein